jgi:PelA/Pel-15E family pectate lyase
MLLFPMKTPRLLRRAVLLATLATGLAAVPEIPDLEGFEDAIHHWQNRYDRADYPRFPPGEVAAIADNILLWQRANGGWKENEDPARILDAEERAAILADRAREDTSFDNRNVWPQVRYLAAAYSRLGDERYRAGCERGIEFVLAGQHPSGGWPHSYPSRENYRPHLTFADDIIPDQLSLLRAIAAGEPPFSWTEGALRARAAEAVVRGDRFILDRQILQGGAPTIWAGQYHTHTLEPTQARAFEHPGLVSRESVTVVRYLMSIPDPTPEVIAAVEAAVTWFEGAKLHGWRLERFEIEAERYDFHTARFDRRLVADPDAPPLWARFYDLESNEPFLANRDGQRVLSLAEVARERRTGYDWYGTWPQALLETEYPAWRASLAR